MGFLCILFAPPCSGSHSNDWRRVQRSASTIMKDDPPPFLVVGVGARIVYTILRHYYRCALYFAIFAFTLVKIALKMYAVMTNYDVKHCKALSYYRRLKWHNHRFGHRCTVIVSCVMIRHACVQYREACIKIEWLSDEIGCKDDETNWRQILNFDTWPCKGKELSCQALLFRILPCKRWMLGAKFIFWLWYESSFG